MQLSRHLYQPFFKVFLGSLFVLFSTLSFAAENRIVIVDKPSRTLWLVENNRVVDQMVVSLGDNPTGHKTRKGDDRTPEGRYLLTFKNSSSQFYRSIHINYPSPADRSRAYESGYNPGGSIKIHGLPSNTPYTADVFRGIDWTNGCIAVSNKELDRIWRFVSYGTPIHILGATDD